jgi:hypothetical protein
MFMQGEPARRGRREDPASASRSCAGWSSCTRDGRGRSDGPGEGSEFPGAFPSRARGRRAPAGTAPGPRRAASSSSTTTATPPTAAPVAADDGQRCEHGARRLRRSARRRSSGPRSSCSPTSAAQARRLRSGPSHPRGRAVAPTVLVVDRMGPERTALLDRGRLDPHTTAGRARGAASCSRTRSLRESRARAQSESLSPYNAQGERAQPASGARPAGPDLAIAPPPEVQRRSSTIAWTAACARVR